VTQNLVNRAERCGFRAIVLTVDTPYFGLRRADVRNRFALPNHMRFANFEGALADGVCETKEGSSLNEYIAGLLDRSLTWKDVAWLKRYLVL
jgi:(S)-2-hydroxy-acid oxidase